MFNHTEIWTGKKEIRLIKEIIFYNFSVSSFVSSNAPHPLPA